MSLNVSRKSCILMSVLVFILYIVVQAIVVFSLRVNVCILFSQKYYIRLLGHRTSRRIGTQKLANLLKRLCERQHLVLTTRVVLCDMDDFKSRPLSRYAPFHVTPLFTLRPLSRYASVLQSAGRHCCSCPIHCVSSAVSPSTVLWRCLCVNSCGVYVGLCVELFFFFLALHRPITE